MNDAARRYLDKARQALLVARSLRAEGYFAESASRAYYAMFYAAQSLLNADGVEVVKHSAVEAEFGRRFAKTGRLDPRFHRMLINARKTREVADYDIDEEIEAAVAEVRVEEAHVFVDAIASWLAQQDGPLS